MRILNLADPLYRASITYIIGGTVPELLKYLKKTHKSLKTFSWDAEFEWGEDADTTDGYQFHVNSPLGTDEVFYVWVNRPSPFLLFHETYHLVGDILHNRGIVYSEDSEEAFAYLGGWIFEEVLKLLKGKMVKD